jgi:hypothetical protein
MIKTGLCGGGAATAVAGAGVFCALVALANGDIMVLELIAPRGRRTEARRRTIGLLVFSWSSYRPSIAIVVAAFEASRRALMPLRRGELWENVVEKFAGTTRTASRTRRTSGRAL